MRIVLDTSILVRGASAMRGGLAKELVAAVVESPNQLVLSTPILTETSRVLRYPRMKSLFQLSEEQVYGYVSQLRSLAEIVSLDPFLQLPIRDQNDLIVLQTAVSGAADAICTSDEDFFEGRTMQTMLEFGIAIVRDEELMRRLRHERSRMTP